MRVLIVKSAALGDVLRTTSVAAALKRRHPRAGIWWVTSRAARPLLERNPHLERVLALEAAGRVPAAGFDLVLSLEEDLRCARLAARACRGELVGVTEDGRRLSYTASAARYYDMSLLNRDPDGGLGSANRLKAANRLTYPRLWLKMLELPVPAGRLSLRPVLRLSARERGRAAAWARGRLRGAVGVNPGAGRRWPAKQMSPEKAARLIRALGALGRPVLLFGGPDEAARNARILSLCRAAGVTRVVDAGTRNGLRAFAARVGLCGALVSTDSLAFHVATALGVPAVALVGPTSAAELDAFGKGEVLPAEGCACFYRPRCSNPVHCLEAVPEIEVAAAVRRWLR